MSVMAPLDYLPDPHARSSSVSSSSDASRPPSSHDLFHRPQFGFNSIATPGDSPPAAHHTVASNAAIKNQMAVRNPHLRHAARAAASPYSRDAHSQSGSEAEQDDLAMYLSSSAPADYSSMYMQPSHHHHHLPHTAAPHHLAVHSQDPAASFGRMTLSADMTLEHLANNVRAATTTSASDRAKQIFVQAWLTANYATYPDGNVPRQGLYFSYRRVCEQYQIPHINTATLGKAIRLCFPTIKTRRLGVRGNSKYHYCGIRPATAAEAEFLQEYIRRSNNNAGLASASIAARPNAGGAQMTQQPFTREGSRSDGDDEDDEGSEGNSSTSQSKNAKANLSLPVKSPSLYPMDISDKTPTTNSLQSQAAARPSTFGQTPAQIRKGSQGPTSQATSTFTQTANGSSSFLAHQAVSVRSLPNFPNIEEAVGQNSSSPQGLIAREVWGWFEEHLDTLLDNIRTFRFEQFEMNVRAFWQNLSGDHREVVHAPAVAGLMARADALVYDEILGTLRSQILSPIPALSLAALRQLADKMEKTLLLALENYGPTFVEPKVELGARFGHLVLRFLDMYQVTQALTTVLGNPKQLADMRRSWASIDFESVRNQAALVCNCRHEDLVQLLEVDFVKMMEALQTTNEPVRTVMAWADECCERLMGPRNGGEERGTMSSRSILIRWGYVTSQIMRDLTIRSDPAFGAFQILKLFLDDWIALNVLRSVALSTNSVQASVEPAVQQAFFSLSPMAGQESFSTGLDRPAAHLSNTPTTSSMLAALNDPFPAGSLDPTSTTFNTSYSYMDTTPSHADGSQGPMSFGDFTSDNAFDVAGFTQDLGSMQAAATPASQHNERDVVEEVVKEETV